MMGKRLAEVVDLTTPDEIIDLTQDSNRNCAGCTGGLRGAQSNAEIQWISKRPKLDPSRKFLARPLSAMDNMNSIEFRKDGFWFEQAELLFSAAMPQ